MEPHYSVVADWLSKFHTWPVLIQALWVIAIPVTVLGVTWLVTRGIRDVAALFRGPSAPPDLCVYGLYAEDHGRLPPVRQGNGAMEEPARLMPPSSVIPEPRSGVRNP